MAAADSDRGPDGETCHFHRLPAEMRNEICQLAINSKPSENIAVPFPGITGTCAQFRRETLPVYLAGRTFDACINDLDAEAFLTFLKSIEGLEQQYKNIISPLTIHVTGTIVGLSSGPPSQFQAYYPNYSFWNEVVMSLKLSGLRPQRIRWPSSLLQETVGSTLLRLGSRATIHTPIQSCILYNKVLPSALKNNRLYDYGNPPVNVMRKLADEFEVYFEGFLRRANRVAGGSPGFGGGRGEPPWRLDTDDELSRWAAEERHRRSWEAFKIQQAALHQHTTRSARQAVSGEGRHK